MKKFDKGKFKKAVIAAEAAKARLSKEVAPKATSSQRAAESLLAKHYREAGLDVKKLAALQKQHAVELRRNDDAEDAAARKRAAKMKNTIHSSIDSQSKALRLLTERKDFFPYPSVSLDKPFLILGHPNSILWDQSIEPFNSWAKFKVDTTAYSGYQKVSFYFLWSNDSQFYSVINASTFMSATGRIRCIADGGAHGLYSLPHSDVSAGAQFSLWPWWQHPATPTPAASTVFASPRATADLWDESNSAAISHGASLDKSLFLVPPNGVVVLEALEKRHASKLTNKMREAGNAYERAVAPEPDRRAQRDRDRALGLVAFAVKLPQDLVRELQRLSVERNVALNDLTAEAITKGLGSKK